MRDLAKVPGAHDPNAIDHPPPQDLDFPAMGRAAARAQWRKVADQLRPTLPKLAMLMDEAEADVLAYMSFPATHRTKLHAVNPLDRLNGLPLT